MAQKLVVHEDAANRCLWREGRCSQLTLSERGNTAWQTRELYRVSRVMVVRRGYDSSSHSKTNTLYTYVRFCFILIENKLEMFGGGAVVRAARHHQAVEMPCSLPNCTFTGMSQARNVPSFNTDLSYFYAFSSVGSILLLHI